MKKKYRYTVTSAVGSAGDFSTLKAAKDFIRMIKAAGPPPACLRIEKIARQS